MTGLDCYLSQLYMIALLKQTVNRWFNILAYIKAFLYFKNPMIAQIAQKQASFQKNSPAKK